MACELTTLSTVKGILGITGSSQDTVLQAMIDAVSLAISNHCDTDFCNDTYVERVTYSDAYTELRNTIQYLVAAKCCSASAIRITPPSALSRVSVTGDKMILIDLGGNTEIDISVTATLSSIVTQIVAASGWSAELLVDDDYAKFLYLGNWSVNNDEDIDIPYASSEVSLSNVTGRVLQSSATCSDGIIIYQGGYLEIPADLAQVANKSVVSMYDNRKKQAGLKSEKVGDYSYTLADDASNAITAYSDVLSHYCRITI